MNDINFKNGFRFIKIHLETTLCQIQSGTTCPSPQLPLQLFTSRIHYLEYLGPPLFNKSEISFCQMAQSDRAT